MIERLETRCSPASILITLDSSAFDEGLSLNFSIRPNETSLELAHAQWRTDEPGSIDEPAFSQRVTTIDGSYGDVDFAQLRIEVDAEVIDGIMQATVLHAIDQQLTADFLIEGDEIEGDVAVLDGAFAEFEIDQEFYGPKEEPDLPTIPLPKPLPLPLPVDEPFSIRNFLASQQ